MGRGAQGREDELGNLSGTPSGVPAHKRNEGVSDGGAVQLPFAHVDASKTTDNGHLLRRLRLENPHTSGPFGEPHLVHLNDQNLDA